MTLKNTGDLMRILEGSIESQLIAISIAASECLDIDRFESYNSIEDTENDVEVYQQTLGELRTLKNRVGAKYIYALKRQDDKCVFVFDTDEEEDTRFTEYELHPVHEYAFFGQESAGIMNVSDEFGNFNTGAVPILKDGKVIGIICADIEDAYVQKSNTAALVNAVTLVLTLFATMCVMIGTVWLLLQRVQQMQDKLFQMANHDVLTQLPNRQYLMSHLAELAEKSLKNRTSFVLLMIDLDNFKSVNDKAGHDAGDELLRSIAAYLDGFEDANATSFHPSAGALSVSARLGGDEFIQIIPDIGTLAETEVMAARLLDKFGSPAINPFIEKYNVGLSIGAAIFPFHTSNYHTLIKYADLAMYNAKKGGKHGYRVYTEEMSEAELDNDGEHDRRHRAR